MLAVAEIAGCFRRPVAATETGWGAPLPVFAATTGLSSDQGDQGDQGERTLRATVEEFVDALLRPADNGPEVGQHDRTLHKPGVFCQ